MFTPKLSVAELISVVMAPSTTSGLRYEMSHGLSLADYLQAPRPDKRPAKPPGINDGDAHIGTDVMSIAQFEERMRRLTDG